MALVCACMRCPVPTRPVVTQVTAMTMDSIPIRVEVHLCHPCRNQAARENLAAANRSTGKDVSP